MSSDHIVYISNLKSSTHSDDDGSNISAGAFTVNGTIPTSVIIPNAEIPNYSITSTSFVVGSIQLDYIDADRANRMMFDKSKGAFYAGSTSGTQWDTSSRGNYSAAFGYNNTASGQSAFAIGSSSIASNTNAFAAGNTNIASGTNSAAIGYQNTASGSATISAGYQNNVSGLRSIALGYANTVSGDYSVALGRSNSITGSTSVAIGHSCISSNSNSFACGRLATASGTDSFACGTSTIASGNHSFACGKDTVASGNHSFVSGQGSTATVGYSTAMGYMTTASGNYSVAMGESSVASNTNSFATGNTSTASGTNSVSMGYQNTASGAASFASGYSNTASGENSIAMGRSNTSSGENSIAIGKGAKIGADKSGSFVWRSSSSTDVATEHATAGSAHFICGPTSSEFRISFGTVSAATATSGATGYAWASSSDINLKENLVEHTYSDTLEKIMEMPIYTYNFKSVDPGIKSIGPVAQDFNRLFPSNKDPLSIVDRDMTGVALAGIRGLNEKLNAVLNRISDLEAALL